MCAKAGVGPGLLHGWQAPKYLSHPFCLPECTLAESWVEVEVGLDPKHTSKGGGCAKWWLKCCNTIPAPGLFLDALDKRIHVALTLNFWNLNYFWPWTRPSTVLPVPMAQRPLCLSQDNQHRQGCKEAGLKWSQDSPDTQKNSLADPHYTFSYFEI